MLKRTRNFLLFVTCIITLNIFYPITGINMYAINLTKSTDSKNIIINNKTINNWAKKDIYWASQYDLIPSDLLSDFQKPITIQQLCSLSVKLYEKLTDKLDTTTLQTNSSHDVEHNDILKAYNLNIIKCSSKTSFSPNKPASLEQAAIIFYNTLKATNLDISLSTNNNFKTNYSITPWSLNALSYMSSNKIIDKKPLTSLTIKDYITREEAIVIIKKLYECIIRETQKASKGVLYKISDNDSSVYLLGSIHLANNSIYPFSNKIENAFNKSNYLVVEGDIDKIDQSLNNYILQKSSYQDYSNLKDHVSDEIYDAVTNRLNELKLPENTFDKTKPWYVYLSLSSMAYKKNGFNNSLGIDYYFLKKAKETNKKILELEGLKYQIDLFDNFSDKVQEQLLKDLLSGNDSLNNKKIEQSTTELLNKLLLAWKRGDINTFDQLFKMYNGNTEFDNIIINTRNKNMSNTIVEYLDDPNHNTYFIVIGTGHLVNNDGIINSLKSLGYNISQIK